MNPPIHFRGGYSNGRSLKVCFMFGARALHDSHVGRLIPTNELLGKSERGGLTLKRDNPYVLY